MSLNETGDLGPLRDMNGPLNAFPKSPELCILENGMSVLVIASYSEENEECFGKASGVCDLGNVERCVILVYILGICETRGDQSSSQFSDKDPMVCNKCEDGAIC